MRETARNRETTEDNRKKRGKMEKRESVRNSTELLLLDLQCFVYKNDHFYTFLQNYLYILLLMRHFILFINTSYVLYVVMNTVYKT